MTFGIGRFLRDVQMDAVVGAIGLFAVGLAVLIGLRARFATKFDLRGPDIVAALVPVGLLLFLTGRIGRLELAELSIEAAFVQAAESEVEPLVAELSSLPVESIKVQPKSGVGNIEKLIREGSEALSFSLRYGGYDGRAVRRYLEDLTAQGSLEHLVITDEEGRFFGMADAMRTASLIRIGDLSPDEFAEWLAKSDEDAIMKLPGFVPATSALTAETDKRMALETMQNLGVDKLPVVNSSGKLLGLVDRSRLSSSIIVDIADQLAADR